MYRRAFDERLCVSLQAGDALFIPAGYWHQVDSSDVTIAVNFWWTAEPAVAANRTSHGFALFRLRQSMGEAVGEVMEGMVRDLDCRGDLVLASSQRQESRQQDQRALQAPFLKKRCRKRPAESEAEGEAQKLGGRGGCYVQQRQESSDALMNGAGRSEAAARAFIDIVSRHLQKRHVIPPPAAEGLEAEQAVSAVGATTPSVGRASDDSRLQPSKSDISIGQHRIDESEACCCSNEEPLAALIASLSPAELAAVLHRVSTINPNCIRSMFQCGAEDKAADGYRGASHTPSETGVDDELLTPLVCFVLTSKLEQLERDSQAFEEEVDNTSMVSGDGSHRLSHADTHRMYEAFYAATGDTDKVGRDITGCAVSVKAALKPSPLPCRPFRPCCEAGAG